jgi:hypothetical protein
MTVSGGRRLISRADLKRLIVESKIHVPSKVLRSETILL